MGLLSNLFGRKASDAQGVPDGRGAREATAAIREARAGRMPVPKMLQLVVGSQVLVPLASPPVIENESMKRWKPATVTKQADGGQFIVAFTDRALMSAFAKSNPEHSFGFLVDTAWLLTVLPQAHGIAFNLGGDNGFEWNAEGIAAFEAEHRQ